jgi:hypothetical protein
MRPLSVVASILLLVGCAAPPTPATPDPYAVTPTDLGIDVAILGQEPVQSAAVEERPGRFILFPDGSLHYGSEPDRGTNWRPGLTRRLTREQVAEVWTLARRSGLADPANADAARGPDPVAAPPDTLVYRASFIAGDEHWTFIRESEVGTEPDPAIRELIRALARLAWVPDRTDERIFTAPIRYDFGPDPYARFRW